MRVLLVTAARVPEPGWTAGDGTRFHLSMAPSVAAARALLAELPTDVVVVDASIAAAEPAELQRLRENLGGAALLLRANDYTPDISLIIERSGGAACLLPATAPAAVQAQIVGLAAERGRLTRALTEQVDELQQRTRELEETRSRFRHLIDRNADAIVVVDPEGVIRFANAMAAELFRTPREDLPGSPFGFPVVVGETTELDLLQTDGPRVAEMRVVESEWEGETAYIASLRDITERKKAEEGARRLIREQTARTMAETAAHRFRFLAEASTLLSLSLEHQETLATLARVCVAEVADWAVIYVVNEGGTLERLEVAHRDPSKADLVREIREQPIDPEGGHPVLSVLRTRSPLLVTDVDEERLAAMAQDERHLELLRQLGVSSFMVVPLVARDNALGAIALISSDPAHQFTEADLEETNDLALRAALALDNARLYREAQEANQAKTDLLAVISHDLRTPLNSIMGHAGLLSMGIPDKLSSDGLERVERIRVGATHLLYLIDELLSFARLEAGREEMRLQDVDANDIAREAAGVIEPLALDRGLSFHLILPEQTLPLRTDPDRLRQVLLNLVGNALKYTEHGEVRLELRSRAGDGVEFEVQDTGIGIRPEHLSKIFEPFWQVERGQRGAERGTGLGLSVVRGVVRLLGGHIAVESVVGSGSKFTVRLPARPET